jgi:3D (Asp-Asp-Asp) domain-containing protein
LSEGVLQVDVIGSTVADALVSVGLDPESGIAVRPSVDTPLEPEMIVTATGVFMRVVEEETDIAFETETVDDPDLLYGRREVVTEGVPGRKLRIFEVVVTDGQEGARVLKAERLLAQPVDEVVAVGTKRPPSRTIVASRGDARDVPAGPAAGEKMTVEASAYTPGHGCGYSTATGMAAGFGVVAVDPSVIPLGTRLYIPGYGYGVAADTGGSIKGTRIDLCFETLSEALAWGRRTVAVTIVE